MKFQAYLTTDGITSVHRAGCADLHPNRLRNSQHDRPYDIEATYEEGTGDKELARQEVAGEVMSDFEGEMEPDEMVDYVRFAPCTDLGN